MLHWLDIVWLKQYIFKGSWCNTNLQSPTNCRIYHCCASQKRIVKYMQYLSWCPLTKCFHCWLCYIQWTIPLLQILLIPKTDPENQMEKPHSFSYSLWLLQGTVIGPALLEHSYCLLTKLKFTLNVTDVAAKHIPCKSTCSDRQSKNAACFCHGVPN